VAVAIVAFVTGLALFDHLPKHATAVVADRPGHTPAASPTPTTPASTESPASNGSATGPGTPPPVSPKPKPTPTTSRSAKPSPKPSSAPLANTPVKPPIVSDLIPFGAQRQREMVAYSRRHYGDLSLILVPKVIVLHYTAGGTYAGVRAMFSRDTPNRGELPGTVSHFVVDTNGRIYQLLPLDVRGRHTIGLNNVALGIEMVQDAGSGPSWADQQILHRTRQIDAALRLVAWLQARYGISSANVIGHAMANASPLFKDLEGWRNDHVDWQPADVAVFRQRLKALR
jgi:N-acetylmuramoyl-L-alanine amidase